MHGVWPAAVTPFDSEGAVDGPSLIRLLSFFRASGCQGVVVAGTNGEGPSLSAVEKRDLLRLAVKSEMPCLLGIATPSLTEAVWLAEQAGKCGAAGVLLMAPGYFRNASAKGVVNWMLAVADSSPVPVVAYNFPKYTGFTFDADVVKALARHPNIQGFKDSSGDRANLAMFRFMAPDAALMVGDETLAVEAGQAGWQGCISGAANLIPNWLCQCVSEPKGVSFEVVLPVVQAIRAEVQPAANKAVLHRWGVISRPDVRLPLLADSECLLAETIESRLGMNRNNLGIPPGEYGD